jgi:hypothetical protein
LAASQETINELMGEYGPSGRTYNQLFSFWGQYKKRAKQGVTGPVASGPLSLLLLFEF